MNTKRYKQFFDYKETRCTITTDSKVAVKAAKSSIKYHRNQLEKYIQNHQKFFYSLRPVPVNEGPTVAKLMAEAAERANVGPMAAVAGVLADLAVRDMVSNGAKVAVVEDGGEVSAVSNEPIDIALLAGDSPLSRYVGFRLENFPVGVATSSGIFSHALSFGESEAVTVFATNAGVADAAATFIGNLIKGDDHREVVKHGIAKGLSMKGVRGILIVYREIVGKAGEIPQIIKVST